MLTLPFLYVHWHYTLALADMVRIIGNLVWFFHEFFSIPLLLKTLFTPFERITDNRKKKNILDFEAMGEAVLVNTIMRLTGASIRLFMVGIGLICMVSTVLLGGVLLFVWVCAPLVLFLLFVSGITLIAVG